MIIRGKVNDILIDAIYPGTRRYYIEIYAAILSSLDIYIETAGATKH